MITRTLAEVTAAGGFFGWLLGIFPFVAGLFGAMYWISMFIIKLPELKEAIKKLRNKKGAG